MKKKKIIIVLLVMVVVISFGIYGFLGTQRKKYVKNLHSANSLLVESASHAEKIYNKTSSVWYDSIHEEINTDTFLYAFDSTTGKFRDFSDALVVLYSDENFAEVINSMNSSQEAMSEVMKLLQNPPNKYSSAYDTINEMYKDYVSMVSLVSNPSGSYKTFTEEFSDLDADFMQNCKLLQTQLPQNE